MFLGIDVGTQSVKALLYDGEARRIVDVSSAPLALTSKADGTREQLADWWLIALRQCIAALDATCRNGVLAIGVSGQQHGFVPLGSNDKVLAPVKLWCDTATVAECEQITAAFGGRERCINEVGNAILAGYTAPKIRWLKNHLPDAYARLATILLPHDYLNFYLTGERAMECGDASGTGMLDVRQRQWHLGMLHAVDEDQDLLEKLPPLVAPDVAMGQLRVDVAKALGLRAGTPVASGGGDNMMAAIGTGNVGSGRMTVSLGTSATMFASSDKPIVDPAGTLAAFCSSTGGWLPLLCTMNCTVSTELTRQLFRINSDDFERCVGSVPPGSNGVMTLPFFNGERSPDLPRGKACILGLDAGNYSENNLLRSAMEAAIYGLRAGLDAFVQHGCDIDTIRLTGGGAGSTAWRQIVSDVFNLPVSVQTVNEGAALGAALQALWVYQRQQGDSGELQTLLDAHLALDTASACVPRDDNVAAYAQHYRAYRRHIDVVTPLYV